MDNEFVSRLAQALQTELGRVIVGKPEPVRDAVLTLLCSGHLLIEDVPGVGKTTLAKALAKAVGGEFRRVQFTPDLLPSDITGSSILNRETNSFEFMPGPLFANFVLVDEINRATPKTQSALLEAMEERQVSVDGETRPVPSPFFVMATQNNIEMTGTYPLPEAQLDRFFARIAIGYPDRNAEAEILGEQQLTHPLAAVNTVATLDEILAAQNAVRRVHVSEPVKEYVVDVVRGTRDNAQLALGASPRGSLYLMLAGQARAAMDSRDYVSPDDIKAIAPLVLGHRVIVRAEARARGATGPDLIKQVLSTVPTPHTSSARA
ncbi:MAG: MoxR family ATPase [Fimbriimonadaceae bacterium]|nr:MoxR family ATPase [Fimbriimonadaceae bacterium]